MRSGSNQHAGRERQEQRRCFIWSTLEERWRWWQITVILRFLSSQECKKRRSSEESLHHTHRENKLCRLCLTLHMGCFRALTATLGILVSGIVLLQWTELGSNLLRVFQQNLIWKKKGLAFKYLIVAAACNYTRTPCSLHLNLLGMPFWVEVFSWLVY